MMTTRPTMTEVIDIARSNLLSKQPNHTSNSFNNVEFVSAEMATVVSTTEPVIKDSDDDIEATLEALETLFQAEGEKALPFATPPPTHPAAATTGGSVPASAEAGSSWGQRIQAHILTTLRSGARITSVKTRPQSPMPLQRSYTGSMIADQVKRATPKRAARRSLDI